MSKHKRWEEPPTKKVLPHILYGKQLIQQWEDFARTSIEKQQLPKIVKRIGLKNDNPRR